MVFEILCKSTKRCYACMFPGGSIRPLPYSIKNTGLRTATTLPGVVSALWPRVGCEAAISACESTILAKKKRNSSEGSTHTTPLNTNTSALSAMYSKHEWSLTKSRLLHRCTWCLLLYIITLKQPCSSRETGRPHKSSSIYCTTTRKDLLLAHSPENWGLTHTSRTDWYYTSKYSSIY